MKTFLELRFSVVLALTLFCAPWALAAPAQSGKAAAKPAAVTASLQSSMDQYLKIQEALAADQLDGVTDAAKALAAQGGKPEVTAAAQELAGAKDIKSARESFKKLSAPFVAWAEKAKPASVQRVSCSMAQAKWLQKKGDIRNPYYGKAMLECGEIEN